MFQELFDAICEKAVLASSPAVADVDLRKPYLVRGETGGTILQSAIKPPRRTHQPKSLEAIGAFATHNSLDEKASSWFDRLGVMLFPVDVDREDVLAMSLSASPQLKEIISWEKAGPGGTQFDQKAIRRMLMVRMRGCLANADDILQTLASVRWAMNDQQEKTVLKGKSSLGKSLQTEFIGIENLPDYLTFNVPIWETGFVRFQQIEVALEPDEQTQSFRLIPVTGAIETAVCEAEVALGESLRTILDQSIPVYYGKP